jgi:hypothetical protein
MNKLCLAVLAIWCSEAPAVLPGSPPKPVEEPTLATMGFSRSSRYEYAAQLVRPEGSWSFSPLVVGLSPSGPTVHKHLERAPGPEGVL